MSESRNPVRSIFLQAVENHPPEEWEAYLIEACGNDLAMRDRVKLSLEADQKAAHVIDLPLSTDHLPPIQPAATRDIAVESPGSWIGPYRLVEEIGEGGMGKVYMAEQSRPVKRKVALKIIKPGMDTRQVVVRFEAERQALAMMDHPNIATVLDGGATGSGRPYFVMELVRGIPITEYCDRERLSIRDRLELFVLVCRAVQHAHQKGIIHRDLKPSNILVTVIDGAAVPKVIDFGVAKATESALADFPVTTGFRQFLGTPLYMSPEQADISGADVDTRSDIYSLGVLLYELLTGTTPFGSKAFQRASLDEMRRIICEDEPPRPSLRLSSLGTTRTSISTNRGAEPRQLDRTVRGDLDWIVMKAIDKDRRRRYQTANDFAADLLRFISDQPIEARPPSTWYRARKFTRRNRVALATGGLAALVLLGLMAGYGSMARDRSSLRAAGHEALGEADRWGAAGRRAEELEALKRAEAMLRGGRESADQLRLVSQRRGALELLLRLEEVRLEIASEVKDNSFDLSLGDTLYAQVFREHGIDVESLEPEQVARLLPEGTDRAPIVAALDHWARIRRQKRKPGDNDQSWKRLLATAGAADPDPWRGPLRDALGKIDIKSLMKLQAAIPADNPHPSDVILLNWTVVRPEVWDALRLAQQRHPEDFWLNTEMGLHMDRNQPLQVGEAVGYFRAALALRPRSAGAWLNLGVALADSHRSSEALAAYDRAIQLKPDYVAAHCNRGSTLLALGKRAEGIAAFREAMNLDPNYFPPYVNLGKALFEDGKLDEAKSIARKAVQLRPMESTAHHNLGTILSATNALDDAEAAHREAVRLDPRSSSAHNGLGTFLSNKREEVDAALACFRRAIEIDPRLAIARENLGSALYKKGDLRGSVAAYREAIRLDPKIAQAHAYLGKSLAQMGKTDEALPHLRKAIELKPDFADGHTNLGVVLNMTGKPDEAARTLRRAIELNPKDSDAHYNLGTVHLGRQAWGDAEREFMATIELKPSMPEAHCNLGHALREKGEHRSALAELRLGHELGKKAPGWSYPSDQWVNECQALILEEDLARTAGGGKP